MLGALRADALTVTDDLVELRVGLPWIRSLPLGGVSGLTVSIDEQHFESPEMKIVLGDRLLDADMITGETNTWWYLQDRLVVRVAAAVSPGTHRVAVDFTAVIPYLRGPDGLALRLPFHLEDDLVPVAHQLSSAARFVGAAPAEARAS